MSATAFVLGWPVAHSRSPLIHRFWLRRYGIAGDYVRQAIPPQEVRGFLSGLPGSGFAGGNVTIPHKEAAFAACGRLTDVASRLRAVNTLWLEEGRLCGDNTDAHGFAANLDDQAPQWRDAANAIVIGAGGASRAVLHALIVAGCRDVAVLNRTPARAEALARQFGHPVRAAPLAALSKELPSAGLIVNATAAGMDGRDPLAVDWSRAPPSAIAADLVYTPLETSFLQGARARGLTVADGLGMLLHQAAPGFERWFGVRPAVDSELRTAVLADLVP